MPPNKRHSTIIMRVAPTAAMPDDSRSRGLGKQHLSTSHQKPHLAPKLNPFLKGSAPSHVDLKEAFVVPSMPLKLHAP